MLNNLIIAAIPHTEPWGFNTAFVMIICNLFAVAIAAIIAKLNSRAGIFSWAELVAAMSFGHILGVGFVLGLTNIGII
ncbi:MULTISPECIES: photosystem I reaction center subunit PsaK [unclassified Chamaesiphon]|uniref:photosystem I reaction center subunit PsaK n=1 Tax=unclassified Chamaesiphon TaxID=2620921 RepID=UPI00286ABB11|nr:MULTISPECIES: photosystem I reaction center subunit PsaK [unclassified Chamaesiphon]